MVVGSITERKGDHATATSNSERHPCQLTLLHPKCLPRLRRKMAHRTLPSLCGMRPFRRGRQMRHPPSPSPPPIYCWGRTTLPGCIPCPGSATNWTTWCSMTTRSASFLAQGPQFRPGAGVTTCAMGPARCISVVRSFFEHHRPSITINKPRQKRSVFFVLSPTLSSILLFSLSSHVRFFSTGLGVGGLWGLREGARRPLAVSNNRLRVNSILNAVTRRGTFIGNSAGVLGASFSTSQSTLPFLTHDISI